MKRKIIGTIITVFMIMGVVIATDKVRATWDGFSYLTEQATLTVTGVDEGDEFRAYKILDVYKNDKSNEIEYRFTREFEQFLLQSDSYMNLTEDDYYKLTSGDITSGSTKTVSTLDKLMSSYISYIRSHSQTITKMTTNGTTASLTAEVGSYLVYPTSTTRIYAVMVGNLDYKEENGEWVKQNATIVAKVSDPTITTSIKELGKKKASFTVGEEYSYFMEVTVPQYPTNALIKEFDVRTAVGDGITISSLDSITILDGEKKLNVVVGWDEETQSDARILDETGNMIGYIVKQSKDDLSSHIEGASEGLDFTFDSNFITSQKLTISYKAKLNSQAKVCQNYAELTKTAAWGPDFSITRNQMTGLLVFDTKPYYEHRTNSRIQDDTTEAFTYRLQIKKYAFGDTTKMLDDATFEIYSDKELTKKVGTMTTGGKYFQDVPVEGDVNEFLEEYLKDKNVGTDLSDGVKEALRQYIKDTEIEDGSNGKRFVYVIPNDIDVDTFIDQMLENNGVPEDKKEANKQNIKENMIQYDENRKSYIFFQEMGTEEEVDSFLDYYLTLPYKALFDREKEVIKSYMAKNEITSEKGLGVFSGLGEGDYYLKEVKAPTGYSLLKTVVPVSIHYDNNLQPEGETEYCGPVLEIANQKAGLLPFTGGLGTIIYTVVGSILIISGGVGLMYYKKRKMVS